MKANHRIHLCLAKMSDNGMEQKYIQEAFQTNWVAPLGPNVDTFERVLEDFLNAEPCIDSSANARRSTRNDMHGSSPFWPCHSEGRQAGGGESMDRKPNESEVSGNYHVAALSSCTAAIHLALLLLGVSKDDEVLCQSFSFCASSNPVTYCGAKPIFVDSEEETWNMSPELLEEAIQDRIAKTGKKPKAIIVVDLYGMPAKWDEITAISRKYDIPVIEDAANALGSYYKGKPCGTFGDIATLSFNGNKIITTSGGGALVCKDEATKKRAIFLATQAKEPYLHYEHETIGYNYRMSNICAGIGRGQMTVLEEHIQHHKHVHEMYEELLKDVSGITVHSNPHAGPPFGPSMLRPCSATAGSADVEPVETGASGCWYVGSDGGPSTGSGTSGLPTGSGTLGSADVEPVETGASGRWYVGSEGGPSTGSGTSGLPTGSGTLGSADVEPVETGALGSWYVGSEGGPSTGSGTARDEGFDSNFWLTTVLFKQALDSEALCLKLDKAGIEARPLWKPMHLQPVYKNAPAYTNGVSEKLYKTGICLPSGPWVTDDDIKYIVETIHNLSTPTPPL